MVPASALVAGCDGDQPNSQADYCAAAAQRRGMLSGDAVSAAATGAGAGAGSPVGDSLVDAIVDQFTVMHQRAPLAVEPEWGVLEALMRAAAEIDTTDPNAMTKLAEQARLAKTAADRVIVYTDQICGVLLGDTPVTPTPLVPHGTGGTGATIPDSGPASGDDATNA